MGAQVSKAAMGLFRWVQAVLDEKSKICSEELESDGASTCSAPRPPTESKPAHRRPGSPPSTTRICASVSDNVVSESPSDEKGSPKLSGHDASAKDAVDLQLRPPTQPKPAQRRPGSPPSPTRSESPRDENGSPKMSDYEGSAKDAVGPEVDLKLRQPTQPKPAQRRPGSPPSPVKVLSGSPSDEKGFPKESDCDTSAQNALEVVAQLPTFFGRYY